MTYQPNHIAGSVTGLKTAVETPAEAFAGSSAIADRSRLVLRNASTDKRLRFGVSQSNLQRDGAPIEPGDEATLHPTTAVFICSEGAPCPVEIEEK